MTTAAAPAAYTLGADTRGLPARFESCFATAALDFAAVERPGGASPRVLGSSTVLGLPCRVEVLLDADGLFVALCARPLAERPEQDVWPLLTSFPDLVAPAMALPDAEADSTPVAGVFLQHLALAQPLLLFTAAAGSDPPPDLAAMELWADWRGTRPVSLAHHDGFSLFGGLGLKVEAVGPLAVLRQLLGPLAELGGGPAQASIQVRDLPWLQLRQPITGDARLGPLELGDAALTLAAPIYPCKDPARVSLSGTVALCDQHIELSAEIPMGGGDLVVTGKLSADASAPIDGIAAAGLPAFPADRKLEVELLIDAEHGRIDRMTVFVERDGWDLLAGLLTVQQASFAIHVDDPLGERAISGQGRAKVRLGNADFEIGGRYPDGPITGALTPAPGQALTLHELAAVLHADSSVLPDLAIASLRVRYGLGGEGWAFAARIAEAWQPPSAGGLLQLEQLEFSLAGPSPVDVHLDARLRLGTALGLAISATHHGADGWVLCGSSDPGARIEVGQLLQALEQQYGQAVALPQALLTLAFEDLSVMYREAEQLLVLAGSLTLQVEGADLRLDLDAQVQGAAAARTVSAEGRLTVAGQVFTFSGRSKPAAQPRQAPADAQARQLALVASYVHDPAGSAKAPDIHDLVAALSPRVAGIVPHVELTAAVMAYLSDGDAAHPSARWLLGACFNAGFELHGTVDGVPIVSALLGDSLDLAVKDLQVLVASRPYSEADITALGPLPAFNLPAAVGRALITGTLQMGGDTHALSLPLGATAAAASATAADSASSPAALPAVPAIAAARAAPAAPAAPPPAASDPDTQWIPIARHFGPLYLEQAGVAYRDGQVSIALGLSLSAGALTLSLQGLRVETPLNAFQPHFDLAGLGLAYSAGDIAVSGGLLKTGSGASARYDGEALIRSTGFSIAALGSYASTAQGDASLFVYGLLDKELGGPSVFHVTGLAAGFGYNRKLQLPTLDEVGSYPLVTMAEGSATAGATAKVADLAAVLAQLDAVLEVAAGGNWLALGVRFTSYEVVDTFALLVVSFGTEVEIDFIGESTLNMPTKLADGQQPIAHARLSERATFIPDRGILSAAAKLGPESYVLSKDCHLSGGFALASWFKDEHAGDFVVTLGGYHPSYVKPAHYPDVAPLEFIWKIGDLEIKGGMYFALTPGEVMAGGHLDAVWQSGELRAWFLVHADFLLCWKPFHYEAEIGVSIGASFRVDLWITSFTMTVHVDVALQLWGPSFGGVAVVDLSVISFSVAFGAPRPAHAWISWPEFRASFLPPLQLATGLAPRLPARWLIDDDGKPRPLPTTSSTYCLARAGAGLDRDLGEVWIVSGSEFQLVTHSVIPARTGCMYFHGDTAPVALPTQPGDGTAAAIAVGPMNLAGEAFISEHFVVVSLLDKSGQPLPTPDFLDHVDVTPRWANVPPAIWSLSHTPASKETTLKNALVGYTFAPKVNPGHTATIEVAALEVQDEAPLPAVFRTAPAGLDAAVTARVRAVYRRTIAADTSTNAGAAAVRDELCSRMIATLREQAPTRVALLGVLAGYLDIEADERIDALPLDLGQVMRHAPAFATLGDRL